MAVIWKSVLEVTYKQDIPLPYGAEVLTAKEQYGRICIWYKCEPDAAMEDRTFIIMGTGETLPDFEMRYIDTVSLNAGGINFMCHVYEKGK